MFFLILAIGFTIATTVLASRKGRNPVNWFFLSLFWGVVGLIILACAKDLDQAKGERDTLSKVLLLIVIIPVVILAMMVFFYRQHKQGSHNSEALSQSYETAPVRENVSQSSNTYSF